MLNPEFFQQLLITMVQLLYQNQIIHSLQLGILLQFQALEVRILVLKAYQQKNQELVIFHLQQVRSIPRSCLPVKVN